MGRGVGGLCEVCMSWTKKKTNELIQKTVKEKRTFFRLQQDIIIIWLDMPLKWSLLIITTIEDIMDGKRIADALKTVYKTS